MPECAKAHLQQSQISKFFQCCLHRIRVSAAIDIITVNVGPEKSANNWNVSDLVVGILSGHRHPVHDVLAALVGVRRTLVARRVVWWTPVMTCRVHQHYHHLHASTLPEYICVREYFLRYFQLSKKRLLRFLPRQKVFSRSLVLSPSKWVHNFAEWLVEFGSSVSTFPTPRAWPEPLPNVTVQLYGHTCSVRLVSKSVHKFFTF